MASLKCFSSIVFELMVWNVMQIKCKLCISLPCLTFYRVRLNRYMCFDKKWPYGPKYKKSLESEDLILGL